MNYVICLAISCPMSSNEIGFFSRKKIGCAPTGILVHKAKATGFSFVSEMLQVMDLDNSAKSVKEKVAHPKKSATLCKV